MHIFLEIVHKYYSCEHINCNFCDKIVKINNNIQTSNWFSFSKYWLTVHNCAINSSMKNTTKLIIYIINGKINRTKTRDSQTFVILLRLKGWFELNRFMYMYFLFWQKKYYTIPYEYLAIDYVISYIIVDKIYKNWVLNYDEFEIEFYMYTYGTCFLPKSLGLKFYIVISN